MAIVTPQRYCQTTPYKISEQCFSIEKQKLGDDNMSEKSASFKKEKGMLNTTIVKKKLNVIILIMNELKIIFRLEKN